MTIVPDRLEVERTKTGLKYSWYVLGIKEPVMVSNNDHCDKIIFNDIPASITFEFPPEYDPTVLLKAVAIGRKV